MKFKRQPGGFEPFTITVETRDEALAIWHRMNVSTGLFGEQCVAVSHRNGESETPFDVDMDNIVAMEIWQAADTAINGPEEFDND